MVGTWSTAVEVSAGDSVQRTIASLLPGTAVGPVLVFGPPVSTQDDPETVVIDRRRALRIQLTRRFAVGVIMAEAWQQALPEDRRTLVHNLVAHLLPGALVWVQLGEPGSVGPGWVGPGWVELVAQARAQLIRITPQALAQRLVRDPECVVLDTRTAGDRGRFGAIPGSRHLPRSTLEWRVDPASGYSQEGVSRLDQCLVVVCTDGYSSSLAAVSLQRLGFIHATDLIGGFTGWRDAGMPVVATADSTAGDTTRKADRMSARLAHANRLHHSTNRLAKRRPMVYQGNTSFQRKTID